MNSDPGCRSSARKAYVRIGLGLLCGISCFATNAGAQDDPAFDGTFDLGGGSSIAFGGFLRADLIHDFDAIGSEDSFNPTTIPTDGSEGTNTRLHAKWTRLHLDFRRPSRLGEARIYIETDFFSDNNGLRIRHAFAEVGPILAGQNWSTFMDEDIIIPNLDLEEPRAFIISRRAMLRWTGRHGDHVEWAVALEDPDGTIDPPIGVTGNTEYPLPDLAARLRWDDGTKHVQLSAFLGKTRFQSDAGPKEDVTAWGLNLSGRFTTVGRDVLRAQVAWGPGVSAFRGNVVAGPDENNDLVPLDTLAATLSYQHYWRNDLWSVAVYSVGDQDNSAGQADDSIRTVEYAALDLIWEFAEKMTVGAEWLYGTREDKDGAFGDANRLLFVFQMDFF